MNKIHCDCSHTEEIIRFWQAVLWYFRIRFFPTKIRTVFHSKGKHKFWTIFSLCVYSDTLYSTAIRFGRYLLGITRRRCVEANWNSNVLVKVYLYLSAFANYCDIQSWNISCLIPKVSHLLTKFDVLCCDKPRHLSMHRDLVVWIWA